MIAAISAKITTKKCHEDDLARCLSRAPEEEPTL